MIVLVVLLGGIGAGWTLDHWRLKQRLEQEGEVCAERYYKQGQRLSLMESVLSTWARGEKHDDGSITWVPRHLAGTGGDGRVR